MLHYPDIPLSRLKLQLDIDLEFFTDLRNWIESVTLVDATIAQGVEEFLTAEFKHIGMK